MLRTFYPYVFFPLTSIDLKLMDTDTFFPEMWSRTAQKGFALEERRVLQVHLQNLMKEAIRGGLWGKTNKKVSYMKPESGSPSGS